MIARMGGLRVVALIATYNERRFVEPCLEHLHEQGIDAYLIDNGSTDETVALAERRLGRGLIGIESFPRGAGDVYDWRGLLRRKEELARELDADWFVHLDPDEVRLPPSPAQTLAQALEAVDREGFNAVDFVELTFVPSREQPDHDHPDFRRTLRTYYPFAPRPQHQLKAWKASAEVELAASAGHRVAFPGLRPWPRPFPMKHYLFLSVPHAIEKYVERRYRAEEVEAGWHGWRARLTADALRLPSEADLRVSHSDADLDPSEPRRRHHLEDAVRDLVHPGLDGEAARRFRSVTLDSFCHAYTPAAGDTVVDVGAGIGEEALTFSSLVGPTGRVVCVEAHPGTFERLEAAIERNRLGNVEAVNLAIADRRGEVQLSDEPSGRYTINRLIQVEESIAVPAETLDGLYERCGLERVDLLKMNIEGGEGLAIQSWDEALRRTRHVAISCHDFVLAVEGASPEFATFERVKAAVERAGFAVETRPDAPEPWNRYYVYGRR